jgi:hypothetical protein
MPRQKIPASQGSAEAAASLSEDNSNDLSGRAANPMMASKPTGLVKLLEHLTRLDGVGLFQEPLDAKETKQLQKKIGGGSPMDFCSMKALVAAGAITSISDLRTCFVVLCDNACAFSKKGEFTWLQAVSLKEKGSLLLDEASEAEHAGKKLKGAIHIGDTVEVEQPKEVFWTGKVADIDEGSATLTVKLKGCNYDVTFSEIRGEHTAATDDGAGVVEGESGEWRTKGHPWLGVSTRRSVDGSDYDGTITHWLPPRRKAGPGELWKISLSNGDEVKSNEQGVRDAMHKLVGAWSAQTGLNNKNLPSPGKEGRAERKSPPRQTKAAAKTKSATKPAAKSATKPAAKAKANAKKAPSRAAKQKRGSSKAKREPESEADSEGEEGSEEGSGKGEAGDDDDDDDDEDDKKKPTKKQKKMMKKKTSSDSDEADTEDEDEAGDDKFYSTENDNERPIEIAKQFGVSTADLLGWNAERLKGIRANSKLMKGTEVIVAWDDAAHADDDEDEDEEEADDDSDSDSDGGGQRNKKGKKKAQARGSQRKRKTKKESKGRRSGRKRTKRVITVGGVQVLRENNYNMEEGITTISELKDTAISRLKQRGMVKPKGARTAYILFCNEMRAKQQRKKPAAAKAAAKSTAKSAAKSAAGATAKSASAAAKSTSAPFAEGSRVDARWKKGPDWYAAVVEGVRSKPAAKSKRKAGADDAEPSLVYSYELCYDDDGAKEVLKEDLVRARNREENEEGGEEMEIETVQAEVEAEAEPAVSATGLSALAQFADQWREVSASDAARLRKAAQADKKRFEKEEQEYQERLAAMIQELQDTRHAEEYASSGGDSSDSDYFGEKSKKGGKPKKGGKSSAKSKAAQRKKPKSKGGANDARSRHRAALKEQYALAQQRQLQFVAQHWDALAPFTNKKPDLSGLPKSNSKGKHAKGRKRGKAADDDEDALGLNSANLLVPKQISDNVQMRDYQQEGLEWLVSTFDHGIGAILADEMGLGKTLQTIAFLAHLKFVRGITGPHLVVVPLSVLSNWKNEFRRFCPALNVVRLHSADMSERERLKKEVLGTDAVLDIDVVLTTYEMVKSENMRVILQQRIYWRYLVLDEGHMIKNEASQISLAVRKIHCQSALLLTGTPLQNNLHELWAVLNFLFPLVFPDSTNFDGCFDLTKSVVDTGMLTKAHSLLRPFMLRRLKVVAAIALSLTPPSNTLTSTHSLTICHSLTHHSLTHHSLTHHSLLTSRSLTTL